MDIVQAGRNFREALACIRGSLKALIDEMNAFKVEKAEVKFGIKGWARWATWPLYGCRLLVSREV